MNVQGGLLTVEDVAARLRLAPYTMEVEDVIAVLDMDFHEGTILKSLIRRCVARKTGVMKTNYDGPEYDAEKIAHSGARLVAKDKARLPTQAEIDAGPHAGLGATPFDYSLTERTPGGFIRHNQQEQPVARGLTQPEIE